MEAMRARLLAAMGLGSLVGCPEPKQPAPAPAAADAVADTSQPEDATVDATEDVSVDASVDADVAMAEAAVVSKKPGITPLPKDAWYVSYPLANPKADYCKNGSAVCVPLDWAVKQQGTPGQTKCPPEIVEKCRCPAGMGCKDDPIFEQACPEAYHNAITLKQRAAGKKDACCYAQEVMCTPPWVGRALRDDDHAVLRAPSARRRDWSREHASIADELSAEQRAAVAAHYAEVAAGEHASVASFAHTSLELMSLGAPPELLAETHRAALDEIEHARLAYALASAYGAPVGPGPLPMKRGYAPTRSELAVSTLRDACIPEAVGALLAAEVARAATAPAVRDAMKRIAEDEARHAELAFRTLAWAVRTGGSDVARAVEDALADAAAPEPGGAPALPSHGLLGAATERAWIARAMTDVVVPCVTALLRASSSR